jgi:hypothetical protein
MRTLTLDELETVSGGRGIPRVYDSTDYEWTEMGTADYELAFKNFKDDVFAGMVRAVSSATSQAQAEQMAQAYINSLGLGSVVHVNDPTIGPDDIVITATDRYEPLTLSFDVPVLTIGGDAFASLNTASLFEPLDEAAITVEVQFDNPRELTEAEKAAIEKLKAQILETTFMLNLLPPNGVFTFSDGRQITVAELKALWAKADFVVTDKSYAHLGTADLPGGGAATGPYGNPLFEVNITHLTDKFMANPSAAMWYPLHELAHVTLKGKYENAAAWADGVKTSPEHRANEQFANSVALAIVTQAERHFSPGFMAIMEWGTPPAFSDGSSGGGSGGSGGPQVGEY